MSANINATEENNTTVDAKKRAFMAKFGQYAVAGAGMSVLMAPSLSATTGSGAATTTVSTIKFDNTKGAWYTDNHTGMWESLDDIPTTPEIFKQWTSYGSSDFTYTGVFGGGAGSSGIIYSDGYDGMRVGTWASDYTRGNATGTVTITWDDGFENIFSELS